MKGKAASAHLRRTLLAVTLAGVVVGAQLPASSSGFAAARPPGQAGARTTAPVKLPASSGEPAATQPNRLTVGEQPDRRTRYSSTRYNADHTFTTTISNVPVNYRVRNGGWEPIDSTLVSTKQTGFAYQNRANAFQTLFKDQLGDDYLGLMIDGQLVTLTLQGASKTKATTKGATVIYQGALSGVDANYNVSSGGLEEVLTLKDGHAQSSFQFLLKTPKGTTASQKPDGSWAFFLPGRAPSSFALRAPVAYDSGSKSGNASQPHSQMSVKRGKDDFEVTLSVDQSWLKDPSRKFPVYIDPTFTIQPDVTDLTFDNNCSSCGASDAGIASRLTLGNVPVANCSVTPCNLTYVALRNAIQFDLSGIPGGATISAASLRLFWDQVCSNSACDTGANIEAHLMTAAWGTSSTTSQLQFGKTALSTFTALAATAPPQWMTFDISSTVSSWVSGSQANYGLYLLMNNDSKQGTGGPAPPAASFPAIGETPQLVVTYGGDSVVLNQAAVLHANGAELSWSQYTGPSGAPFQKYEVHRSKSKGFTPSSTTLLTTLSDVAATSYRDTTAAPNGTFYYAVVANSSKSNEVKVTLPADGQSSMSLQPGPGQGKATYIGYSTTSTNCANYGADPNLKVGSDAKDVYRSLISFDLHALPVNAGNISAKLNLVDFNQNTQSLTLHAYPVTAGWDEGTGLASTPRCTGDGATWYERTGGVSWSWQGGDFDSQTASNPVTVFTPSGTALLDSFDVSNIVSLWASGRSPNLGFIVKADDESQVDGNATMLASNDYGLAPGNRPTLQMTYTDGSHATVPTVSVSAPAPGAMVSGSTVTLSAAASSPGTLTQVQFFVDGTLVGTVGQAPWQVTWNSASVANGSHTITATATDSAGNSTTSAGSTVTVNNYPSPTTTITAPISNASVSGTVTVNTTNTVASGLTVSKVELYVDGALYASATASPWSFSWNTLDPTLPSFDGSHTLTSKVYDSSGLIVSSPPITVTVANTAGTLDQAVFSSSAVPQAMTFDPSAASQLNYPVNVIITNTSGQVWNAATTTLRYRWFLAGSNTSFTDSGDVASLGLAAGQTQTTQVNVIPPSLPAGMDAARFTLRFDLVDSSGTTSAFFADKGNPPLDNPVIVNKVLKANIGLEHFWQFTSQPVGGGMTHMTNVANGNSLLTFTPWSEPGRGLSTVVRLIYNSREEHSDSPAGNNWSLSISGLSRFGDPLDIHPNNADTIAGRSNKFINLVDGTGRLLTFTGVTNPDGTTAWFEPPGVHLFLRSVTTDSTNPKFWAITRPDRVTFFYNHDGFPTAVTDKNGNTLSFTLSAVQPGDDPGGPKFHVTQVTDAAGQGSSPAPNRSFNITYFTKATARKPQIRGKIASITDHLFDPNHPENGHQLLFSYYDDGNLLSITEAGGFNADGSFLASRSWIFTYTTSDGSGPAIPNASNRVNPDPKTPNESTKVFSVRDPNGVVGPVNQETLFTYNGPTSSIDRWKLASVQDRAGNVTNFSYDNVNQVTTVAQPTPNGQTARTYKYAYDVQGRPTQITDPLGGGNTSFVWSADNTVNKLTEPNGNTRQFAYNDNGYPTDVFDQLGDHTVLTYQNVQADASDVSAHWNPNGGAIGTGRTIPHLSQLVTKQNPREVATGSSDKWSFGYDTNGNLSSVTEPLGNGTTATATTTYNGDGTVANRKDFLGNQTTYLSYDVNGLPTKIADASDSPTSSTHPLQIGYDTGGRTTFVQDENHASFSGGTPANYQTQFFYDSFNRLGRQSTPKSTSLALTTLIWSDLTYDVNNNRLSVVAPHFGAQDTGQGDTTSTSYDVLDRKVQVTDPSGNKTAYTYDVAGRLTQVTLPLGVQNGTPNNTHTVTYGYDALDRTTIQTQNHVNLDNSLSTLNTLACYDSVSNLVSVTAPQANLSSVTCPGTTSTPFTTVYGYDAAHRLTSRTDPLTQSDQAHHQTQYIYDQNGNRIRLIDANGNTTSFNYDALNRLTQTSQPFILSTQTTAAHPVVSKSVYDADGNVVQSFSPRAVDCLNVSSCQQPPSGTSYVTTNHYDQLNQLIRVDLPIDGSSTTPYYMHRAYDFNGNLVSVSLPVTQSDPAQVPAGAKTVSTYFDPGWVASSQVGTNTLIHHDYNGKGQQTCRRPASACGSDATNAVSWSYRPDGRLASRTDQQGQSVSYSYDFDGNLTSSHDASGLVSAGQAPVDSQNLYDDLDRLVRSDLKSEDPKVSNWTFSSFAYDLNGNVSDQDQNGLESTPNGTLVKDGHRLHSDYDQANWLVDQIDNTLNQRVLNSFTPIGLESSREIDKSNGSGGWTPLQTTSWNYFPNGKLSQLSTVNGSGTTIEQHTVSYLDTNPKYVNTSGVYVDGNRTQDQYSLRLGGGTSSPCTTTSLCTATYGYDPRDRLVQYNDGHGDQTSYTLDGAGNIQSQVQTTPSGTTTVSNTYDPNNLNQLQQSKQTLPSGSQTILLYWYDSLGRQQCVTDANVTQPAGICNPSKGVSASPHLLQDYKYDYLDRLQTYRAFTNGGSPTDEADYVYDALNRLVQETEQHPTFSGDQHVTQFSYLGLGGLETEEQQSSKNSGNTLFIKDFTYDVYGHRLAMTVSGSTLPNVPNGTFTYGYDVHGSVSQLVDANGNTQASYGYTPYGQSDSTLSQGENADKTTPINPFRYSAKRTDTGSGSLDMGVRRFGPDTAHFLTPDFFYGSLADLSLSIDPLTDNRYDLAGGNPISFKEWDGHMVLADGGGGAATMASSQDLRDSLVKSSLATTNRDSSDSQKDQDPRRGCNIPVIGFFICRPQAKPASDDGQSDQQTTKSQLCPGPAAARFGVVVCSAGTAIPLPLPKTRAGSGSSDLGTAALLLLAGAGLGAAGAVLARSGSKQRTGEISVDTDVLINAIEGGREADVDVALAGRAPVVSPQVAAQFFVKGDPNGLMAWMLARGGRFGATPLPSDISSLQAQVVATGRQPLGPEDAAIAASARREGLPVLTADHRFYNALQAINFPSQLFVT